MDTLTKILVAACLILALITGCRQVDPTPAPSPVAGLLPAPSATAVPTATFTSTPSPTPSPTATPQPTPTPTPTATAVPISLTGDPRAAQLANPPQPQRAASCGVVDLLDFPIDPPDAANASRGGGDFGVYRDRYGKYHAGEDWRAPGDGSSFGKPVYSIGHGRVMYAEPEGWNRDKGVVIVEHIFADGRSFYSFYGHLDPPSVTLQAGDCIRRGQTVGDIGKPRTSPHLHFEIRTHMPYQPGPGYWEEDPTLAGWLPPSQTIWNERMTGAPGVLWLHAFAAEGTAPIGRLDDETFLLLENGRLMAAVMANGRFQPLLPDQETITHALVLPDESTFVAAERGGTLRAFRWAAGRAEPLWTADLEANSLQALWALPAGGVAAVQGTRLWGLGDDGRIMWQMDVGERPFSYSLDNERLLFTTTGDGAAWVIEGDQPPQKAADLTGYPALSGGQGFLLVADGVYRLPVGGAPELVYALPAGQLRREAVTSLPDGGLLLVHSDAADRRLIILNEDGSLRWERSLVGLVDGDLQLLPTVDGVYLGARTLAGSAMELKVYELDEETAVLTHIFTGGARSGGWGDWWVTAVDDTLLLNTGGGSILSLDPQAAHDLVQVR